MKTLHAKLTGEIRRLEKAMAALSPEPKAKAPPAERAPGAPKRGRPKKSLMEDMASAMAAERAKLSGQGLA